MLTFKEKVIAGEGRNHVCIWKTANEHSWHNALVGARTHSSHTHTLVAPPLLHLPPHFPAPYLYCAAVRPPCPMYVCKESSTLLHLWRKEGSTSLTPWREFQLVITPCGSPTSPHVATTVALTDTTVHLIWSSTMATPRDDVSCCTEQQRSQQGMRPTKRTWLQERCYPHWQAHSHHCLNTCIWLWAARRRLGRVLHFTDSQALSCLGGHASSVIVILCLSFFSRVLDFGKGK